MNAVIDGVKTTITFKSDLPYDDNFAEDLYKVSYDKDGYATDATVAQHKTDYVWVGEYVNDPTKKDVVKDIFDGTVNPKVDLTADGDTLWITDQGKNRGIVLADSCPAVIVEQKLDKNGNWVADKTVEYASVAKAIKALDNYNTKNSKVENFDGTIIVTLKDGIATSVILTDTVTKVDHKKEDTVAGVTASLSVKSGDLTLTIAGYTDEEISYKVIATDIRSQNSAVVNNGTVTKNGDEKALESAKMSNDMSYSVEVTVNGKTMTVSL